MKAKYILLFAAVVIALTGATATTVIPPTFDQLVQQAEVIFQGTVTDVRSAWEGEGAQRHIDTYVTFQVGNTLKGAPGGSYTIRVLGGTVGQDSMEVTCAPKFQVGERQILFVEHNGQQFVPLVGIMHGQLRIERDQQTGREFIATHDGDPVRDLTQLGRNEEAAVTANAAEAISPDDLKTEIQKHLTDQAGHPAK
ncbi:MAG: hypothetical protein DME30_11485 [Verrucomicrobia bacterium]|nr:MAG: hypothetical protein DME30_11485 [Verrucomicrobiota bacterium]